MGKNKKYGCIISLAILVVLFEIPNIAGTEEFENSLKITISNPVNGTSATRRIPLNITTNIKVDRIIYIDDSENRSRERLLCSNCKEYGNSGKRWKYLAEGQHIITIKAIKGNQTTEEKISLFIDSTIPTILRTYPRTGQYTNGSFSIEYMDDNPKRITLYYGSNNTPISDCSDNKNGKIQICNFFVDLNEFEKQDLSYYFEIEDIAGNLARSKLAKVSVDMTPPKIINLNYSIEGRIINFDIKVSENVTLEYLDLNAQRNKWNALCTDCDKYKQKKYFRYDEDQHELLIRAKDNAGNTDTSEVIQKLINCNWRPTRGADGCYNIFGHRRTEGGCWSCDAMLGYYYNGELCVSVSGCFIYDSISLFGSREECENVCQ